MKTKTAEIIDWLRTVILVGVLVLLAIAIGAALAVPLGIKLPFRAMDALPLLYLGGVYWLTK